jgi:ParB/RepB/Spo0J family partition protein
MKSALAKMSAAAEAAKSAQGERLQMISLDKVRFDPNQPRQDFHTLDGEIADDVMQLLRELADDIKQRGLIHPITVCEMSDGFYEVIVGERRTRAHLLNEDKEILAKVRNDLSGPARKLYQLAENIQREDLNEHDLARFIHELVQDGGMQKQDLAKAFKKQPAWITRYLSFADPILRAKWVDTGYISKAWMLYAMVQLPQHLQEEAMQLCKESNTELTSPQLKALEARARKEKQRVAEEAAAGTAAAASAHDKGQDYNSPGKNSGESGNHERTQTTEDHEGLSSERDQFKSSVITALLEKCSEKVSGESGNDGYVPPADQLNSLRDLPASALNSTTAARSQPSYRGDNPVSDFSGHTRISTMEQMPAAATSTVSARISLLQLVTLQEKLRSDVFDIGVKTESLPVEIRFDDALLRQILKALGVHDATDIPQAVLPLKLIEVTDRLAKVERA